jgi:AbrB family looped-hinge helix DNA binding protein
MATQSSRLTSKGQVMIPAPIRRVLGIKPGDNVDFEPQDRKVVLLARPSRLLKHYGSVTPRNRPENLRTVREEVTTGGI